MTSKSKEGCGPNFIVTGEGDPMNDECLAHDEDYDLHLTEGDADRAFIEGMDARVEREPRWYRRPILAGRAKLYGAIVLGVGWVWFKYVGKGKDIEV